MCLNREGEKFTVGKHFNVLQRKAKKKTFGRAVDLLKGCNRK